MIGCNNLPGNSPAGSSNAWRSPGHSYIIRIYWSATSQPRRSTLRRAHDSGNLRSIAIEGDRAVIIVTHDSRIFEFADTLARMDDGHIVSTGTRAPKGGSDNCIGIDDSLLKTCHMISKLLNFLTKFGLPIVAIGLIVFAVKYLASAKQRMPALPPPIQPAANPFQNSVAGAGMVEPETENISIGTTLPGIVIEVCAKVGQHVKAGDPLFRIDDRDKKAELEVRQAMLVDAQAALERLEAMPRPEEMPAAEAKIRETKADWENWAQQAARREKLLPQHATSEEEFIGRKMAAEQAQERYNKAVADYNLLKAGAWEPEKQVARSAVQREKRKSTGANGSRTPHRAGVGRRRSVASQRSAG